MKEKILVEKMTNELGNLYLKLLGTNGMIDFIGLMWDNIKNEYTEMPAFNNLCWRLIVEAQIVYAVALKKREALNKIRVISELEENRFKVKSYEEIEKVYDKQIRLVREYLKENNYKDSILENIMN